MYLSTMYVHTYFFYDSLSYPFPLFVISFKSFLLLMHKHSSSYMLKVWVLFFFPSLFDFIVICGHIIFFELCKFSFPLWLWMIVSFLEDYENTPVFLTSSLRF